MALIRSDIKIYGKHGKNLRALEENGIYSSGAEGFVEAALLGLYYGKKSEPDGTKENEISISRVYFSGRNDLETILFTYLQHEKVYQERSLSAQEVFMYEQETKNPDELVNELIEYALYGIEVLSEKYKKFLVKIPKEYVIDEIINKNLLIESKLRDKAKEDEKSIFYKSFDDSKMTDEVNEIMRLMKDD